LWNRNFKSKYIKIIYLKRHYVWIGFSGNGCNSRGSYFDFLDQKKIPELGSALGKTLRGFKEEIKNENDENNYKNEEERSD